VGFIYFSSVAGARSMSLALWGKECSKEIKLTFLGDATGFFTARMSVSGPAWAGGEHTVCLRLRRLVEK
jgi:hypothetical protein